MLGKTSLLPHLITDFGLHQHQIGHPLFAIQSLLEFMLFLRLTKMTQELSILFFFNICISEVTHKAFKTTTFGP